MLGGQSTLNLGSHSATLLGLTSDNVDAWGSIHTELGKALCNFAGVNSDNADLGGGSTDNQLGKLLWNVAWITSDNVYLGGVNRH